VKDSVLIIGGPGNLSASTIQALLERNYRVAVFSHATFFDELSTDVLTYSGERHNPNALEIGSRASTKTGSGECTPIHLY
jgi:hypothetical protein